MSTEDLVVCVSSIDLLCSAPSQTHTCLTHGSCFQDETQFSKILLVENENANTEFLPTLSSPLLPVKENKVLLPITNFQKQISGFRNVQVPCATAMPLRGYSSNAKTQKTDFGLLTGSDKGKSDWMVWKTTTISLFCVFFVFFVAVDFYYLLHPEIYAYNLVKLKLEFQHYKKVSRNNVVLLEAPCSSKKLHNITRRATTNRSVFWPSSSGHMKSNVFSSSDIPYSDKIEPNYLRPPETDSNDVEKCSFCFGIYSDCVIHYWLTEFGRPNIEQIPLHLPGNVQQLCLIWSYIAPHGLRGSLVAIANSCCWSIDTLDGCPLLDYRPNYVRRQDTDVWIKDIRNGKGLQVSLQVAISGDIVPPSFDYYILKELKMGQWKT
ncbi:hypothetical protein X801_10338 [Opisthorchis viverrini]|uniref:Uncharacterized protein n=2 Tax=Opisthorchis viverrini TaxID=6198 RepID=A0A074Z8R5_OPIVI|nr:hypothetical protein T265_08606 [Opisthorchis viverrini]KER23523.1 hypothetical protein T265_08606 [Opisthorchis viverrini]OON13879.1 hypothetical protein X801_10338 [Opisthorchis viverrini]